MTGETMPKLKAKDNPCYRLATLYGQPAKRDDEIAVKNRVTWNRWMASHITDATRASLLEARRWSAEELTPLSKGELQDIQSTIGQDIPNAIDLSNTDFDRSFFSRGFVFPEFCNFAGAIFRALADFRGTAFVGASDFRGVTFARASIFYGATFGAHTNFDHATFAGVTFSGATFTGAYFGDVCIMGDAYFDFAIFSEDVDFRRARFSGSAVFRHAKFDTYAGFERTTFTGASNFRSVIFSGPATFDRATFSEDVSFVDADLKGQTLFTRTKFTKPPAFFGATLHEGTVWRDAAWPKPPIEDWEAGRFVDAYERLKLEMDRLKRHGDELDFFIREMQCRRVLLGFWMGLPIAVYGFLSDYGRSYFRPLSLLAATVLVGTFLFAVHLVGFSTPLLLDLPHTRQALGISFTNTFGVLSRPLIKPDVLLELPDWLKAVSTIQTMLGIALLFLFGLGLRNRFRMK